MNWNYSIYLFILLGLIPLRNMAQEDYVWLRYDDRDPSWTYTGFNTQIDWESAHEQTLSISDGDTGETAVFSFVGKQVQLTIAKYWNGGTVDIFLDDVKVLENIDVQADDVIFEKVFTSDTLGLGEHQLKIEVTSGRAAVDFIEILEQDLGPIAVTGVSVTPDTITLGPNQSGEFTAIVSPSNATNKGLDWISSDSTIVSVDSTGNVRAISAGMATISAITIDGAFSAQGIVVVDSSIQGPYDRYINITWNNEQRRFLLHHPGSGTNLPVVFGLHGWGNTPENQRDWSRFDQVADAEGFITVYPEARTPELMWDPPAETGFILAIIDKLIAEFNVDDTRIYATGFSAGGFFANYLGYAVSDRIAAIAPVEGGFLDEWDLSETPVRGMPAIMIHVRADMIVLFGSGIDARDRYIAWNETDSEALLDTFNANPLVSIEKYLNGRDSSEIHFYTVETDTEGDDHVWPWKETYGIDPAPEVIWPFFQKYSLGAISPPVVSVSTRAISFESDPDTATFSIVTDSAWTITENSGTWVSLSDSIGTGNAEITITVNQNPGETVRKAKITIQAGGSTKIIELSQKGGGGETGWRIIEGEEEGWTIFHPQDLQGPAEPWALEQASNGEVLAVWETGTEISYTFEGTALQVNSGGVFDTNPTYELYLDDTLVKTVTNNAIELVFDTTFAKSNRTFKLISVSGLPGLDFIRIRENDVISSINKESLDASFRIFPNPTHSSLRINWDSSLGIKDLNLSIITSDSRIVLSRKLSRASTLSRSLTLDLSKLSKGLYFLRAETSGQFFYRKIQVY